MTSPQRARVTRAKEEGAHAADVPRFVSPSEYLPAVKEVRAAFGDQVPKDGFELARAPSGFGASARA